MKTYIYNLTIFFLLFTIVVNAQTFDKKIEEKFKVNPEVELIINAAYTDVEIETWNKNEVSVEAIMEVSGVEKGQATKLLKNWEFEALANKNKVKIKSTSNNMDFNFNNNFIFPEVEMPKTNFFLQNIEFPEMPEMPEMPEFPEIEFDYEAFQKDSLYLKKYKKEISEHVEKFKNSDWKKQLDSMRNSEEFKRKIEAFKIAGQKMASKLRESTWFNEIEAQQNSEEFKQSMLETKKALEEARLKTLANRDEILEQVKLLKETNKVTIAELKRLKEEGKLDSLRNYFITSDSINNHNETIYFNLNTDHKSKVKIKKYLKIKVPKKATFNLNVRHGKVTIPESTNKISANMSYGNFIGGTINGAQNELIFTNSPVAINTLKSSNIILKNVPNAMFGTFSNVDLISNTSDVEINKVENNCSLHQKFGNLKVNEIVSEFKNLNLDFEYAKVIIPLDNLITNYTLDTHKSKINTISENSDFLKNAFFKTLKKHETSIKGSFNTKEKTENTIILKSNFSTITII